MHEPGMGTLQKIGKVVVTWLGVWICDIVLEWLKKIYGWKIWFEYNYLQSRLVIVRFQTEALFTAMSDVRTMESEKELRLHTVHERN